MNVSWGLFPPLVDAPGGRRERNEALARRALRDFAAWP
jgi:hypothetical protein